MGGYGSGRWGYGHDARATVESCTQLSADQITRNRMLRPAAHGTGSITWTSTRTGEQVSSVGCEVNTVDPANMWLRLHYTLTRSGERADYRVGLASARTAWAAARWFFRCPLLTGDGRPCGRRVGKLYLPPGGRYFGCRHCYRLTYTSCNESHKNDSLYKLMARDTGWKLEDVKRAMKEML